MPNLLIDNKVNRVDLVKEGSCSVADILIIKGKDGASMPEIVQEILSKMKPEHKTAISDYIAQVEKAKPAFDPTALDTKAEDDKKADAAKLKKACDDKEAMASELATAKARIAELEVGVAKARTDEENFEEVLKSMPEAAQAVLKQMKQTNDTLIAKAKEAEEVATNEIATAKAKSLSILPIEQDKLVAIIKSKPSEDIMTLLDNLAKAAEGSDIFKSVGTETPGSTAGTSAFDQVEAKAAEIATAKSISIEKARVEVFSANPELYTTYNDGGAK